MSYSTVGVGCGGGCGGTGAYYAFQPGEVFDGMGVAAGISFNGAQVWADWAACAAAWQQSQTVVPQCKQAVDALRAALGQLGYGALGMGVQWGSADQAAYQQWVDKNGLSPSPAGRGMPAKAHMGVMQEQVSQNIVTGPEQPIAYAKVGGEYVPAAAVTTKTAGIGGSTWLLIGAAAIGVGLLAVAAKKKKKETVKVPRRETRPTMTMAAPYPSKV